MTPPRAPPYSCGMAKLGVEGKRVALTGTFAGIGRKEAERALAALGALVSGSVSKATDVLFVGADAGSKRAKAEALGVAIHDEAALHRVLGADTAKPSPATAPKKRSAPTTPKRGAAPDERSASSVDPPFDGTMAGLANEVRAFVSALKKRSDVEVLVADVRKPANKAEIEATDLPADLADFYRVMDGLEIEWKMVEGEGAGRIRLLALRETTFVDDDESEMGFGKSKEAYLFDEQTAEEGTWLVRKKGAPDAALVFASAGRGKEGFAPARSIAEYVRRALHHGVVASWPRITRAGRSAPHDSSLEALARFRGAPKRPSRVTEGARVSFAVGDERGRAEVLALRERGPLVRVRTDDGREGWLERSDVVALDGTDAYEDLRRDGLRGRGDVLAMAEDLYRALGGSIRVRGGLGTLPSNGFRAAGLLATRPLADALDEVLGFWEAVRGSAPPGEDDTLPAIGAPATRALAAAGYEKRSDLARADLPALAKLHGVGPKALRILEGAFPPALDLAEDRPISPKGAAFPIELRAAKRFRIGGVVDSLLAGLTILAYRASAATRRPGASLVAPTAVARAKRLFASVAEHDRGACTALLRALECATVLPRPFAKLTGPTMGWHGLPKTEGVGLPALVEPGKSTLY